MVDLDQRVKLLGVSKVGIETTQRLRVVKAATLKT